MELEACDDILGASKDDCVKDDLVPDSIPDASVLVGETEGVEDEPGRIENVADSIPDASVLVGETEGVEDEPGRIENVAAESADPTPGGESEGKVTWAKKKKWECRMCKRNFGSGQALGGHMNCHPEERIRKAMKTLSWPQGRIPDLQQLSWFQAPPNEFNLVRRPANDMPNSWTDPCYDLALQPIFQHGGHCQGWSQSNSIMPSDAQNWTTPSWNAPGSSSEADFRYSALLCPGPCCNPAIQVNSQQGAQYQEYSMMAPNVQDSTSSIWNAPSSSQPYLGYSDTEPCGRALDVNFQQIGQNQEAADVQSFYRDPNQDAADGQSFCQDSNQQSYYRDSNQEAADVQSIYRDFYQDAADVQSFYRDPNQDAADVLSFLRDPYAQNSSIVES